MPLGAKYALEVNSIIGGWWAVADRSCASLVRKAKETFIYGLLLPNNRILTSRSRLG